MNDKPLENSERRIGVELEFAGLGPDVIARVIKRLYGGIIKPQTAFEYQVTDTSFGHFRIELDSEPLQELAQSLSEEPSVSAELETKALELAQKAAELMVPWEVVSPPISSAEFLQLESLVDALREHGALGTRHSLRYAFGMHLNPELTPINADQILQHLRAYFCLRDWIEEREIIDTSRQLTPYIASFDTDYIQRVLAKDYRPSMEQLIDDYLRENPTRNRCLDMLPLFAHIDSTRVEQAVKDTRINPRPTFHFRLPNCDIDNPDWNIGKAWRLWRLVERLAADKTTLARFSKHLIEIIKAPSEKADNVYFSAINEWAKS
ncbi:amidoligase family protein [Paraferrimonas sedimenticola]|uniref:Amidoligase enzyme n=1 Tax=Paraferrimonas sedimenticola TaxID=375674 RepID=A0AA37VVZ9_9GAMM|nr:amidoligase family protein [Paraferrimonas sedimenticola]GLP96281.1 hypothetical protein GCM10007895_15870 [Paraferrimonas sedimenticola]